MNAEYKGHTYRMQVQGTQSEAHGFTLTHLFLWVDDLPINPAVGTYFEPRTSGGRQESLDYAEQAAKRIIDHLVQTGKTIS
jgi:hypothetical protein